MGKRVNIRNLVLGICLSIGTTAANANIIIDTDQSASGSLGTVHLENSVSGIVVFGEVDGADVRFEGLETLLTSSGNGQSSISSKNDSTFADLSITLPNYSFDRLVFQLFKPAANGTVTIKATDTFGTVFQQTIAFNGNSQFFNVDSDALQQIASVSIFSSAGVEQIRQVRVGGITEQSPVPEPGTYALLASGLGLCAFFKRRSKQSN